MPSRGVRCKWLHSELDAFERVELLRDLRAGRFDALVGVNLLREGLDLPEVSLVAILDADKEGFLRSETSLMQTIGRAARQRQCQGDALRRQGDRLDAAGHRRNHSPPRVARRVQPAARHHADTIRKSIRAGIEAEAAAHAQANAAVGRTDEAQYITEEYLAELEAEMYAAAESLEFERAAAIRDRIEKMRDAIGKPVDEVDSRRTQSSDKSRRRGSRVPRPKRAESPSRIFVRVFQERV